MIEEASFSFFFLLSFRRPGRVKGRQSARIQETLLEMYEFQIGV